MKNFRNDLVWNINSCNYDMISGDSTSMVWEAEKDTEFGSYDEIMITHSYNTEDDVQVFFNGMVELEYKTLEEAIENIDEINDIFAN
jgi:hypothetical protein